MLSYRHAFHAGNHADVLKHFVQIQLLQYMNQKDTAYSYIDTHSGAGVYALDGGYASKNAEYETGIAPLWDRTDLPPALAEYVNLVKAMNPSGKMRYYPGSPYCADKVMRDEDRLRLFELHPADAKILADNFRKVDAHAAEQGQRPSSRGRRVMISKADGFLGLKALLPPPSRRALVLIDPPYEDKMDYRKVKDTLADALVRFPTGIYAVWYPVLQRMESRQFASKLSQLPATNWLHVTLTVNTPAPDGFGLHSSGMYVINPPYTLEPMLREIMPYLVKVLGRDDGAKFVLEAGSGPMRGTGTGPVRALSSTQTRSGPTGSLRTAANAANGGNAANAAARGKDGGAPRNAAGARPTAPGTRPAGPNARPASPGTRPPRNTGPRRP